MRSSYAPSKALRGIVFCDCGHGFCKGCLAQYVRIAIGEGRTRMGTLRCPVDKCKVPMQESLLKDLASLADWEKHLIFVTSRKVTEKPLKRFCPHPNCDGIARLSDYPQAGDAGRYLSAKCRLCLHEFCANCSSQPHQDKKCDQAGDQDYFKWKKGKKVKPCPGCGHDVEKVSGCRHMWCSRCWTGWCWSCGLENRKCKCSFKLRDPEFEVCAFILVFIILGYIIYELRW